MTNADYKEKKMKLLRNKDESTIVVDHLTIRQSIFLTTLYIYIYKEILSLFFVLGLATY
jgi:hypothetical protein